ncbi:MULTISPECIES: ROK family transcriptional regulator [Subtercola]|uniref:ROK family transcriptional regulator n=1 Tax=Subtercola vilae TaxID=2056433 RepID=A0A4V4RGR9_9MICO|nr:MULTISPECIES: ROK family transcriptional regulator [Subtercola]MEA9986682.1 ROK family transcriptional regulator [Subtercola sp. RTI3]TIH37844.1 ROK family transcriptional regulator [Subtercola vilae]
MSQPADLPQRPGVASGTTEELRRTNLARILGLVHREGHLSRAELTRLTGLNRSTVGVLVGELRDLELVYESMPAIGPGNRAGRPSPIVHPSRSVVAIAVNPEVDAIHVGLVSLGGLLIKRVRIETGGGPSSHEVVEITRAAVAGLLAGEEGQLRVVGIGLAVPGLVRLSDGQVRSADHLGWVDEPLTEMMAQATGYRTVAANGAQLGMRAEGVFGAGRGVDDLVYFIGGASGIGGGVIIGGQLLVGAEGYASEFGHTFVASNGALCPCGATGCFEAEVTQAALLESVGLHPSQADLLVEAVASSTDARVAALVEHDRALLRIAVRNAVNLFNPSLVIVGGFLSALVGEGENAIATVANESIAASREHLVIAPAVLGAEQLLIGAGELVFSELLFDPAAILSV